MVLFPCFWPQLPDENGEPCCVLVTLIILSTQIKAYTSCKASKLKLRGNSNIILEGEKKYHSSRHSGILKLCYR